jgi:hypothetical protein
VTIAKYLTNYGLKFLKIRKIGKFSEIFFNYCVYTFDLGEKAVIINEDSEFSEQKDFSDFHVFFITQRLTGLLC